MKVYRFTLAWIAGLAITIVHLGTSAYLWLVLKKHPSYTSLDVEIHAPELVVPLTVTYFMAVTKWFIDTGGERQSDKTYGLPMVIFLALVISAMLVCLPLGAYLYMMGDLVRTPNELNDFYLFVETVLGGAFALLFSDLFASDKTEPPNGKEDKNDL